MPDVSKWEANQASNCRPQLTGLGGFRLGSDSDLVVSIDSIDKPFERAALRLRYAQHIRLSISH
jgi:hypothetical protein